MLNFIVTNMQVSDPHMHVIVTHYKNHLDMMSFMLRMLGGIKLNCVLGVHYCEGLLQSLVLYRFNLFENV